jgi:signal transduction histidine kinase
MPPPGLPSTRVIGFRWKLLVAMMVVVSGITAAALYFAQRNLEASVERDLQSQFQAELAALHDVQEARYAAILERCRALVHRPRIHAALEDEALDLLYPSAADELHDVMNPEDDPPADEAARSLRARFYRFLDRHGAVISPPAGQQVGFLRPEEEIRLDLSPAPDRPELGFLPGAPDDAGATLSEVIAMPIISDENGEVIASLVLGFRPVELGAPDPGSDIQRGIWLGSRLYLSSPNPSAQTMLAEEVARAIAGSEAAGRSIRLRMGSAEQLLFYKRLNPGSLYPPAYEVCVYPLTKLLVQQRRLRWRMVGLGGLLLLGGLGASHVLAGRLSRPVERFALDSKEDRAQRARAEEMLELTAAELQRSARFSADASHQLKTPVTVLRAGLEELLRRENLTADECDQVSALIHQTYRLSNLVDDLLLLSRMDAGRLKLEFHPVNLTQLIEASLDDLGTVPDALDVAVETDFPAAIHVAGEKRYTAIILQNLLENARKYNRPGGRIRVAVRQEGGRVYVTVCNTPGRPIPATAQAHIFERFHRGTMGEDVPGYGLGLNLARELARLHLGDLQLLRSDEAWTEFEAWFHAGGTPAMPVGPFA